MTKYTHRLFHSMPVDPITENYCRHVSKAMISKVYPTPVGNPQMVSCASEVADILGFSKSLVESPEFLDAMSGNALFDEMVSYAHCYGGHQFGYWAGQLGDGRAITLGEIEHENKYWELQLKGAGVTPYS